MLIALKSLLHTVALPPAGPLLVAAAGACLVAFCRGVAARRIGWSLLIAGLASLWLLATPLVANKLTKVAQRYPALDLSQPLDAQALVILGGGEPTPEAPEYGGTPSPGGDLLERVAYGAYVAQHTGLPVLVSGTDQETAAMRESLARDFHVETRWVEDRSQDTFENAQFSARMLKAAGVSRIVLVTAADHEWRAAHEFQSAGLAVVPAPEGAWMWHGHSFMRFVPNTIALAHSTRALYELLGDLTRRALAALDLRRQTP
jgi:uncharacterized SAM-binding protein YcdF (DUF218 family)